MERELGRLEAELDFIERERRRVYSEISHSGYFVGAVGSFGTGIGVIGGGMGEISIVCFILGGIFTKCYLDNKKEKRFEYDTLSQKGSDVFQKIQELKQSEPVDGDE